MARGLVALHRLIKEGKDDSPEADIVRDALDAPLKALNPGEKERAQWLSEDLYSITEPMEAAGLKEMDPQAQQQFLESLESRQGGEWDRALMLLRRLGESVSPAMLSYLRGSIWLDAGYPDVAAEFYGHASASDPANANYRALYLHTLAESDPDSARRLVGQVLADSENQAPVVVARAAEIRFNQSGTASPADSVNLYRELIPVLERNLLRIEGDESAKGWKTDYAMTVALLGFCHEFLGDAGSAVDYYSRGLRVSPNNDALLVARGILQYGKDPRAIGDFEDAVRLDSPLVWPYLFLAHHDLATGRFEQCRLLCEMGLRMRGSDSAKSQLEEWRAIAQAELGFPPHAVAAAFEAALRLDPSNESAKRNQQAFEASLRGPHATPRPGWEQKPQATVRQFGLAEHRYSFAGRIPSAA